MTASRLQIAEIVPATAPSPRPERGTTPQRRRSGLQVAAAGPAIDLAAADHFELPVGRTGNYRFLISPNESNTGVRFDVYRDGGFDRCFSSYWATQAIGVPGAFGYPQENTDLSAGVVGVSAIWTVDLHLNAGELCAIQGIGVSALSGAIEIQYTGDTAPVERTGVS